MSDSYSGFNKNTGYQVLHPIYKDTKHRHQVIWTRAMTAFHSDTKIKLVPKSEEIVK